jgi:hypothetical protein
VVQFQKVNLFILLLLLSFKTSAADFHIVEEGETISDILYEYEIGPIYGKRGHLEKMLKLNPKLSESRGDKIKPGMKILLTEAVVLDYSFPFVKEVASVKLGEPLVLRAREIASEEEPKSEVVNQEFTQHSFFTLSPRSTLMAINSVDDVRLGGSDVTNLTKAAVGIYGEWRIMIRPATSIFIFSAIDFLEFYKDTNFSLTDTSFKRTTFGVGGEKSIGSDSKISAIIQVNQNYFLEVVTPTNVQIRELTQTELKAQYTKNVFSVGKVNSEIGLGVMAIMPSSRDQYKSKLGYGVRVEWTTRFLSKEIQLSYGQKRFSVNSIDNTSKEILATLNFSFGDER